MLRRFESIRDCGIFENYRWNTSVPDFERINLIYGTNGAGKTSLARALDGLDSESGGYPRVSIRMSNVNKGNDRQSSQTHDAEFEQVFVFSDGYVARNHDFGDISEVEAVLTLGERTVENEKRLAELNGVIVTTSGELTKVAKTSLNADRTLTEEHTTIARGVVTALSRAGGEYRSNGSYSKGMVRTRFAGSRTAWTLLSDKDKNAALATVNSDERQTVATKLYSCKIRSELPGESAEALAASPVSVVLDTLKEHEEASSWVDNGRLIHENLDTCIFCGGDLPAGRKKQIEQHFSDEVEAAQRTTDALIQEIKTTQASLQGLLGDGAISGSLFDDLRDGFTKAHAIARTQVDVLDKWLERLLGALEKKRSNVVAWVEYDVTQAPAVDGAKIEQALKEHNDRVSEHVCFVNLNPAI